MRWRVEVQGRSWEVVAGGFPRSRGEGRGEGGPFRSPWEARLFLERVATDPVARRILGRVLALVGPRPGGPAGLGAALPATPGRRLRDRRAWRGPGPCWLDRNRAADLLPAFLRALAFGLLEFRPVAAPVSPRRPTARDDQQAGPAPSPVEETRPRLAGLKWERDAVEPRHVPLRFTRKEDHLEATVDEAASAGQHVRLSVKLENVPDGTAGTAVTLVLEGRRPRSAEERQHQPLDPADSTQWEWVELPLSLLGIRDAGSDLEVRNGELVPRKAGSGKEPSPLELHLPWDWNEKAGDVYPLDCDRFRVHARLELEDAAPPAGGASSERLEGGLVSAELARKEPVLVFANPDAKQHQVNFWSSGFTFWSEASTRL